MAKKIGIIDSGIGGLSLVQEMLAQNIEVDLFYISDRANVPYGSKSQNFMLERTRLMVEELIEVKVECILLACNTLTVETISFLRKEYSIPFVGIEPYIKIPYENYNRNSSFALMLTPATFKSNRFQSLKKLFDQQGHIDIYPMKNLALSIESLFSKTAVNIEKQIKLELNETIKKSYDYIILGCTHYPLISDLISSTLGAKTINPHCNVINQLVKIASLKRGGTFRDFTIKENLSDQWSNRKIDSIYLKSNI